MTAIGFALLAIGLSSYWFNRKAYQLILPAPMNGTLIAVEVFVGFILFISGISKWLWQVMP